MVQLHLLALTIIGLSAPALGQVDFCAQNRNQPANEADTGFRFEPSSANRWIWYSRDKGTQIDIVEDCSVVQSTANSNRPITTICVATSQNYQCYDAPGASAETASCKLSECHNIANIWGWY
ncbi:hypothetical protein GTA08_BOTSDO05970 [Botryosphaeria dothidea]|uniref:Secreted protein n=1 Tax=Botryosphaeria dothidea TaxID=55169 RepID=A0A8H4IUS7_9PEZI|nr:hypothetical protein GTA08_BOTSDO05970 [Botryosphaeria dothidea]